MAGAESVTQDGYNWVLSNDLPTGHSTDEVATKVGSNALNPFNLSQPFERFSVSCYAMTSSKELLATALVLTPSKPTKGGRRGNEPAFTCTIQVLWVHEDHRRRGLGQCLYDQVHYNAFVMMQIKADALELEAAVLAFQVAEGECAKQPTALLLYHKNGWGCSEHGGKEWTADMVKRWPTALSPNTPNEPELPQRTTPFPGLWEIVVVCAVARALCNRFDGPRRRIEPQAPP